MKKRITRKLMAALAVAMLFVGGAMAQTHPGTTIPGAAADYAAGDVQTETYITEGKTVPMYALPDAYYHPNYDVAGADFTLTDGFVWTWTEATTTLTFSQNGAEDNYVAITAPAGSAAGSPYTLSVTETADAAYGGCAGAAQTLTVNVVAVPDVTIGGDATYTFCDGSPGAPANIQSTITGGWQNYRLVWTLEIATLDATNAKEFYYDDENGTNPDPAPKYAVEYTTAVPQEIDIAANAPDLMTVSAFNVINNGTNPAATVYTYVLTSINDQASRYGDFIGLNGDNTDPSAFMYYAAGPETVTVTVYPAPVTGPIYHIIDTWSE
jgi:hypothetical protein